MRSKSEAEQRRELGGYSAAELDVEFVRSQRSDFAHIAFRLTLLGVVYGTLARGIRSGELSAAFQLLPIGLEFVLVMWVGQWLTRRVVACPAFAKSAGKPALTVFWTLLVATIIGIVLAWDEPARALRWRLVAPNFGDALRVIVDSGLVWALIAMTVGLGFSTATEVARWKKVGGVFVWTSITDFGMRLGMLILVLLFVGVALGIFADLWAGWIFSDPQRRAWFVYGLMLAIELLALVVGVLMHRQLSHDAARAKLAHHG